MPVVSPGAESLRLITEHLHTREQQEVSPPDAATMAALGGGISTAQYLGIGREVHNGDANFGMYVRSFMDTNQARSTTHELHIDVLSAEGLPLRRRLGRICLAVGMDGYVHSSAGGFAMDSEQYAPLHALEHVLGRWTARLTLRSLEGSAGFVGPGHPDFIEPGANDLLPLREFLNDPANRPQYAQYDPQSPYHQNLRTAESPRPKASAASGRGNTIYDHIAAAVSRLPFNHTAAAGEHLTAASHAVQEVAGDTPAPALAGTLQAIQASLDKLTAVTSMMRQGYDHLNGYTQSTGMGELPVPYGPEV